MTTTTGTRFEHLLSARAAIGRAASPVTSPSSRPISAESYEFGGGRPDPASFPYDELVAATARMMAAEGAEALTYGDLQGYLGLREVIAHKYRRLEGLEVGPEDLLITNGSGHAISLVIAAFVDLGDPVICEAPTFMGTLNTLRRHGAELHDVPIDDEGIVTGAVRERLEALRSQGRACKLIYTMTNFHNPAGPTMSLARRRELLAIAREFNVPILEDDAYGELRFAGEALPSLFALDQDGLVLRCGTLSKILGAGTRLGWVLAPRELLPVLQSFNFGGGVSPFTSRVVTYYLRDHLEEHVARLVEVYRAKRDAMLKGLREVLADTDGEINEPDGGFFIWIKLPSGTDRAAVARRAQEAGVGFVPGASFFPNGGGEGYIRLAYSYESPERCYTGARAIAEAIYRSID